MRDTQGFYIYRNKRLLTFGTWFRLTPKSELAKLARVRVDTPNTLDKEWRLGIMKSSVQPPKALRDRLASLVPRIVGDSERVSRARNILAVGTQNSAWVLKELGNQAFSVNVNLEYPLLKDLDSSLDDSQRRKLRLCLDSLESLFPFNEIYDRLSGDSAATVAPDDELIGNLFKALLKLNGNDKDRAFSELLQTPPVSNTPGFKQQIEENKSKYLNGMD
jgi:hypothetical protein